jgi:hypothetical protein
MKILKRMLKSEVGQVLPVALVLLALGGFLVVPVISLMTTNLNANRQVDRSNLEVYAADAGAQEVLWHVKFDTGYVLPPTSAEQPVTLLHPSINGRNITATISKQGTSYRIRSTATSPDSHYTQVECYLDILGSSDLWNYAVASLGGNITLNGNAETTSVDNLNGDVYSNGNIILNGNGTVNGDASSVGTITTNGNAVVTQTSTTNATPLVASTVDTAYYKSQAQNIYCQNITCGGTNYSSLNISTSQTYPKINVTGDLIVTAGTVTFNDTVCVGGNLKIQNNSIVTFKGPVKVTGYILINGNSNVTFQIGATPYPPTPPPPNQVCVTGYLEVDSNANVNFQGPVSVTGNLNLNGNNNVPFGSTVYVGGNLNGTGNKSINLSGTVYVVGSINLTNNTHFSGAQKIFAETGLISLSGNTQLSGSVIPFIMAINGGVNISNNSGISGVIYAPNGDITMAGNTEIWGCVVGKSVTGSGNTTINYLMELRNRSDLPGRGTGPGTGTGPKIRTYTIQ